jgi:hypothetical protein
MVCWGACVTPANGGGGSLMMALVAPGRFRRGREGRVHPPGRARHFRAVVVVRHVP